MVKEIIIVGEHHVASALAGSKNVPQEFEPLVRRHREGWWQIRNEIRAKRVAVAIEGNLSPEEARKHVRLRLGDLAESVEEIYNEIDHPEAAKVAADIKRYILERIYDKDKLWAELKPVLLKMPSFTPIHEDIRAVETWEEFERLLQRYKMDLQELRMQGVPPGFWGERERAKKYLSEKLQEIAQVVLDTYTKGLEKLNPVREAHMAKKIAEIASRSKADVLLVVVGRQHMERLAEHLRKMGLNVKTHDLVGAWTSGSLR